MRITLVGSGAMACYFAARLAPHADVTLLGTWPEGVAAVASRGVCLEADGGARAVPVHATAEPREAGPANIALVLVKSWQTGRAAGQAREVLAPHGLAVTLQNGLGNLERLREGVGVERATLGVTTLGVTLLGPGHVREGGRGPVHLPDDARLDPLADSLHAAGLDVFRPPTSDLQPLLWGKLVVNCGINPLTALLRVPNGRLLEQREARQLMERAACEAAQVAHALGIRLPYGDPARRVAEVARATAANRSSMLQDVLRGAPTEIDAINGAVVREGKRLGVGTPVNETLWALVRAIYRGFRDDLRPGVEASAGPA